MHNPICDFAVQKILTPENRTEPVIVPTAACLHRFGFNGSATAVGNYFDREDVNLECHFAVDKDGTLFQFMPVNRQADAQAAGNDHVVSVETWDGGRNVPLHQEQVETLIRLAVWLEQEWLIPPRVAMFSTGTGWAWHSRFPSWNPNSHDCPGTPRVNQLQNIILPAAREILNPPTPPEDDMFSDPDRAMLQKVHDALFIQQGSVLDVVTAANRAAKGSEGRTDEVPEKRSLLGRIADKLGVQ